MCRNLRCYQYTRCALQCARVHGQGECGWKWTSIYAPTEFELLVVQCQTLVRRCVEESERSCRVYECDELGIMDQPPDHERCTKVRTALCLSCMYRMLCNTPPRIELHKSSVVVSGWMLPRYTVLFAQPGTPKPSGVMASKE